VNTRPSCAAALLRIAFALILFGVAPAFAADLLPVPPLRAPVTDLTATLTPEQQQRLEASLVEFERQRGSQIAVLIVASTRPESIEQFGIRVAEAWQTGRKGIDDGVIIIVAKEDRRIRFEVGYGLEGALSDATANRIINETIVPRLKSGDFDGGLRAGVAAVEGVIAGEALPAPGNAGVDRHRGRSPGAGYENLFVIALVAAAGIGALLRAVFGNALGASLTAAATGSVAWWLSSSAALALLGAAAGLALSLFGLNIALAMLAGRGGRFGGGWGGGGYRGGGGSFGGGGASGNW